MDGQCTGDVRTVSACSVETAAAAGEQLEEYLKLSVPCNIHCALSIYISTDI